MKNAPLEADIHTTGVAGTFYPDSGEVLREVVGAYLTAASQLARADKETMGIMLPHAGYIFSGAVAGLTLAQTSLMPEPELMPAMLAGQEPKRGAGQTFVILGPCHHGRGFPLSVWPSGGWRNPLGDMQVDEELATALIEAPGSGYQANRNAHSGEHAIEVIIPFLQMLAPAARIVPISVSLYDPEKLRQAGKILAGQVTRLRAEGRQVVIITSSDMNHFLPHAENMRQDALALDRIRAMDPDGLFQVVSSRRITMCGFTAACLMLNACLELGAQECRITAHTSSGETGSKYGASMDRVVGYAGAIIPWA
ncbi:AmmeMemoRadiSam system protein B [Desulfovibrio sp. OttesenSCG-928-C06]|nr:AmmeMemoRadiSam system protein B [Desulfovibrio sp. OttesenSCG-928-C06]